MTASSWRFCLITAVVLAVSACAGSRVATASPSDKGGQASAPRVAASHSPTGAKGGSPSPISGVADPSVNCVARPTGAPMVLVGQAIYEVADPTHPRLLCQVKNTTVHLFTGDTFQYIRRSGDSGTEVVLHSMGSGNERVVAGWPIKLLGTPFGTVSAWTADGNEAATAVAATDKDGNQTIQIWLFNEASQHKVAMLYDFPQPLTDCICRFGLPPPTLAFSADGQYLVSGWPIGKGATPLRVFSVADGVQVGVLDAGDTAALWSRMGHNLYAAGASAPVSTWLPESGSQPMLHAPAMPYMAGFSPDGSDISYTDYAAAGDQSNLRIYDYNLPMAYTRTLSDQPRSEVTFVKDGWVWYFEEAPCTNCAGQSGPTDKLFAMDLATQAETPVTFAAGQSPHELQSGWSAGQFWPNA